MTVDTKAIRARAEAASPGPWHHSRDRMWALVTTKPDGFGAAIVYRQEHTLEDRDRTSDLMEFIAAARTDVPAMADEIDRLRAAITQALVLIGESTANDVGPAIETLREALDVEVGP